MGTIRRINKEWSEIQNGLCPHIYSVKHPDETDLFKWQVVFEGPDDSPYQGGLFKIMVIFSTYYPLKWPDMHFITPIYHPNIGQNGS